MKHLTVTLLVAGALAGFAGLASGAAPRYDNLGLDQALGIALDNHRSMQVSQASIDIAEAQYRQAMAAFGPKLNLEAGIQRADQDRTFTFSGKVMTPAMDLSQLFGAPPGSVGLPSQPLPLDLKVQMFDRDVAKAGLNLSYPLYTGGKQQAITGLARKGVEIAREEKRKTELEVLRDVHKYYNGAQFARQMEQLASDTLERFQALEDLTDRLYQNASLKVKKTDYLRSKTTTAITRSMLQEARYASSLTHSALANAMGLPVDSELTLAPVAALPAFNGALECADRRGDEVQSGQAAPGACRAGGRASDRRRRQRQQTHRRSGGLDLPGLERFPGRSVQRRQPGRLDPGYRRQMGPVRRWPDPGRRRCGACRQTQAGGAACPAR